MSRQSAKSAKGNIWNLFSFSQDLFNPTKLDQENNKKFITYLDVLARDKMSRKDAKVAKGKIFMNFMFVRKSIGILAFLARIRNM